MPSLGQSHLHLCLDLLGLGHLSHHFHRVLRGRRLHEHFFFARFPQQACTRIIFASVLEEFARLPEFVLVSMIVLIGSVRPNRCLGVTLFSYFRFLFVTCKNCGVKGQGNLLTKISLLHVSTSLCQYASTSVRQYISTPLRCMATVRQYISTSVRQYISTSVRQYAMLPKPYKPQQIGRGNNGPHTAARLVLRTHSLKVSHATLKSNSSGKRLFCSVGKLSCYLFCHFCHVLPFLYGAERSCSLNGTILPIHLYLNRVSLIPFISDFSQQSCY